MMRAKVLVPAVLIATLSLALRGPTLASAQADSSATALALFEQGRQLAAQGKLDQACPKFAASFQLVPKVSTLLNLADCYERSGKLASAWARFSEAAAMANREGQHDRETLARDRAAALEPKLGKLTVATAARPDGMVVKRDGVALDAAVLGSAVPVDAGAHLVEASAPGFKPWSQTVQVGARASITVTVPPLESEARGAPTPTPVPSTSPESAATPAPSPASGAEAAPPATPAESSEETAPSSPGATQRTIGLVVGGVGVAALGAGAIFGALALSAKNSYEQNCGANIGAPSGSCNSTGVSGQSDASNKALLSTVFVIGGAVAAAGGAVLFFTAPRAPAQVGLGPGVVFLRITTDKSPWY
jgi:hypothetical protein